MKTEVINQFKASCQLELISVLFQKCAPNPFTINARTVCNSSQKHRKSGCFARGSRAPLHSPLLQRGKMGRGVVEWSEHLTGEQKGFHTSYGQLFRRSLEFVPGFLTLPHWQESKKKKKKKSAIMMANYCSFLK